MILAVVKGTIISTNKTEKLRGSKLLVVEEWNIDTQATSRRPFVALDIVGAGAGELVLCVSGSSARQTEETAQRPVDLVIIGIVDQAEVEGETRYRKYGAHAGEREEGKKAPPAGADAPSDDTGVSDAVEPATPEPPATVFLPALEEQEYGKQAPKKEGKPARFPRKKK